MSLYSLDEMLGVLKRSLDAHQQLALLAGLCLPRWIDRGIAPGKPLGWHMARLRRAVALGQVHVLFDRYGRQAGSFMWTCLDDAGEAGMLAGGPDVIDADAQSGHGDAWILDIDARFGNSEALLKSARAIFAQRCDDVAYVRTKGRNRIAKRVAVARRSAGSRCATSPHIRPFSLAGQLFHEAAANIDEALQLGECCLLLDQSPFHRGRALVDIGAGLRFPLALGQSVVVRSPAGRIGGLLTFGWLTNDGQRRLREQGPTALSPSCMNEGRTLVGLYGWALGEEDERALASALDCLHPGMPRALDGAGLPATIASRSIPPLRNEQSTVEL